MTKKKINLLIQSAMYILTAQGNGPHIQNIRQGFADYSEALSIKSNLFYSGNYTNIQISKI